MGKAAATNAKPSVTIRPLTGGGGAVPRLRTVPLDAWFYVRGARLRAISSGLLLEESLRFFNIGLGGGSGKQSKGSASELSQVLTKDFVPLSPQTFEAAIIEHGCAYSRYLYKHIE